MFQSKFLRFAFRGNWKLHHFKEKENKGIGYCQHNDIDRLIPTPSDAMNFRPLCFFHWIQNSLLRFVLVKLYNGLNIFLVL